MTKLIVWSRGWLCLLELRNEKEEHLKHQQAYSWSLWADLGMSLEEGMDLELQRPSPHRALLYKEIFRTIRYKLEYLVCKNLMKQCYKTWLFYSNNYDDDNDNDGDDRQ